MGHNSSRQLTGRSNRAAEDEVLTIQGDTYEFVQDDSFDSQNKPAALRAPPDVEAHRGRAGSRRLGRHLHNAGPRGLVGVGRLDATSYAFTAGALPVIATFAGDGPAQRAAAVDPQTALRGE